MKAQISIDWLTFTVKDTTPEQVIRRYLGLNPALFKDNGFGLMGYQRVVSFNQIMVCSDGRENSFFKNMGVCVSMSGSGCRAFETCSSFAHKTNDVGMKCSAFPALFDLLAEGIDQQKVNVTRVDLACDDRAGHLDMETLVDKVRTNEINSRIMKRTVMQQWDGSERSGATVYIGSPSSDFRVRIYDKALEQECTDHWIRVEMVLKSHHAAAFVLAFTECDSVGKLASQIANDKFSFIERDDTNISRCSICAWWLNFIDELESLHLVSREIAKHSVERVLNWVDLQVAPSLAILLKTFGFALLFELAKSGEQRLTDAQRAVIDDYISIRDYNRAIVAAM